MRTPAKLVYLYILVGAFVSACSTSPSGSISNDGEAQVDTEATKDLKPDADPSTDIIATDEYCERSMEMFCGFYMRCGRMAVDDLAACRTTFAEACNARYEPYYQALATRDLLHLSEGGLNRCAERLATVSCEAQVFDLDGCDDLWIGHVPVGGPCGPGLESFVCVEDAVCQLGLNFCGTCQPRSSDGQRCDESARCHENSTCLDGVCAKRPRGGEACGGANDLRCVVGTSCNDGICGANPVGGAGASCSDDRDCRYRASCADNVCVQASLIGGNCDARVRCASGYCDEGRCQDFAKLGDPCTTSAGCETGACVAETCAAIRWSCLAP